MVNRDNPVAARSSFFLEELDPAYTNNSLPLLTQENVSDYDDPMIHFVNNILHQAIQHSASDIHIEPLAMYCRIRLRRDGLLQEMTNVPSHLVPRFLTRLKVMANLDIAERRLPQDGRIELKLSAQNRMDIRINTCPTLFGEKMVLRLFHHHQTSQTLDQLGMTPTQQALFLEKITAPQGLILVTGPTGSGKTVTLYAALRHLNTTEKNISTVEDPIEIPLPGINQVNIHPKIGLDFAAVLRTLLRQDPDIMMIGEIRDQETAKIAIKAAQTGHLVLSTLHTNNAVESLTRLHALGISPQDLESALSLVVAQRLIRRLCTTCQGKKPCDVCMLGYQGRIGIYELLPLTANTTHHLLKERKNGTLTLPTHFRTLRAEAIARYQEGITTQEEIERVLGRDDTGKSA